MEFYRSQRRLSDSDFESFRGVLQKACTNGSPLPDHTGKDKRYVACGRAVRLSNEFEPKASSEVLKDLATLGCRAGSETACETAVNLGLVRSEAAERFIEHRKEDAAEVNARLAEERFERERQTAEARQARQETVDTIVSALNQATLQTQHQNAAVAQQQQLILQQQILRDQSRMEQRLSDSAAQSTASQVGRSSNSNNREGADRDPYYRGLTLDHCITGIFGERNKFAVKNNCTQKIFVTYMARINPVAAADMGLEPGEYKYTGDVGQQDLNKFGGYAFAVCPWGYHPVEQGTPMDRRWRTPGTPYVCRKIFN